MSSLLDQSLLVYRRFCSAHDFTGTHAQRPEYKWWIRSVKSVICVLALIVKLQFDYFYRFMSLVWAWQLSFGLPYYCSSLWISHGSRIVNYISTATECNIDPVVISKVSLLPDSPNHVRLSSDLPIQDKRAAHWRRCTNS